MKRTLFGAMVVLCVAAWAEAARIDTGATPKGLDELVEAGGAFKTALVRPGVDFSTYVNLYPRTVKLVVDAPGVTGEAAPGSLIGKRKGSGNLPGRPDVQLLQQILDETVATEAKASSDRRVVLDPGPDTIALRVTVTDLDFGKAKIDGEPVPTVKRGIIVFDLVDSTTGIIQARFAERRKCPQGASGDPTDAVGGRWPGVSAWLKEAMVDLFNELDWATAG